MDDKALLLLLEDEPEQGMSLLWELYADLLHFLSAQHLDNPDDVQECVNDTLSDFYMQLERFDLEKGSLKSYLAAIAERKAIHRYWENQRRSLAVRLFLTGPLLPHSEEQEVQLRQALDRLSEQDRNVLTMKYYEGYTGKEISERMGLGYETVKKRSQRALKKLQRLMEEE